MPDARVRLEIDGPIATITNDNPEKHNAFDDAMDLALFEILGELSGRPDVRAVIWRGEGKSFSSGRDVAAIGGGQVELTHHELMTRGHRGIQQIFDLDAPIIVAMQGLGDRRLVPAGAALRHPDRGRGRAVHAARGHLRRDPRHRRRRPAVPDVRPRRRQRHGAHRPADAAPRRRCATASCRASCPTTTSTPPCGRWPSKIAAAPAVTVKMARRVIRHLSEPSSGRRWPRSSSTRRSSTSPTTWPSCARPGPRTASPATRGADRMTEPAAGTSRAAAARGDRAARGHLRRHVRVRHRRRHRPGQGDRHRVRPPRRDDRDRQPQARAPRGRARRRSTTLGARGGRVACDIRDPDQIAAAFDAAEPAFGLPDVLVNNAAANFPVPAEDMSPERVAHRRRHHAERHVLLRPRVRPPPPRRRHARLDRERRRVLRVDGWPGLRPLRRGEGGREEPGRDARGRVGPLRHPGERARARACSPTRT